MINSSNKQSHNRALLWWISEPSAQASGIEDDAISSMVGFIDEVIFDGQGRTQLPAWVHSEADIKKDVVTLGLGKSLEMWDNSSSEYPFTTSRAVTG